MYNGYTLLNDAVSVAELSELEMDGQEAVASYFRSVYCHSATLLRKTTVNVNNNTSYRDRNFNRLKTKLV
jgi:hypothetical protein